MKPNRQPRKLTKRIVDAIVPPPPTRKPPFELYWDSAEKGFGLRVTSNDIKSYILAYRFNGRQRLMTIGRHGEKFTPDKARGEAADLKSRIRNGADPLAEKEKGIQEPAFNDLIAEYRRVWLPRKASAWLDEIGIKYLEPRLGGRKLSTITKRQLQAIHLGKGKKNPTAANRLLALLSKMFSLALDWEWVTKNPVKGIEKF